MFVPIITTPTPIIDSRLLAMMQQIDLKLDHAKPSDKLRLLISTAAYFLAAKIEVHYQTYLEKFGSQYFSQITQELNYLKGIDQSRILENNENIRLCLLNAIKLDEFKFVDLAISLGVRFPSDPDFYFWHQQFSSTGDTRYAYMIQQLSTLMQLPQPGFVAIVQQSNAQYLHLSQTAGYAVEQWPIQSEQTVPEMLDSQEPSNRRSDITSPVSFNDYDPNEPESEVRSTVSAPGLFSSIQDRVRSGSLDLQPGIEFGPTVTLDGLESAVFKSAEVATPPLTSRSVASQSIGFMSATDLTHGRSVDFTLKDIIAALDAVQINNYIVANPQHSQEVFTDLRQQLKSASTVTTEFIANIICDLEFYLFLLGKIDSFEKFRIILDKILAFTEQELCLRKSQVYATLSKHKHCDAKSKESLNKRFVAVAAWYTQKTQELLGLLQPERVHLIISSDLKLCANVKNSEGQTAVMLGLQNKLDESVLLTLIENGKATIADCDSNGLNALHYWALYAIDNLTILQKIWQAYYGELSIDQTMQQLERGLNNAGDTLLHFISVQQSPLKVQHILKHLFALKGSSILTRLIFIKNKHGATPLYLAHKNCWLPVAHMLQHQILKSLPDLVQSGFRPYATTAHAMWFENSGNILNAFISANNVTAIFEFLESFTNFSQALNTKLASAKIALTQGKELVSYIGNHGEMLRTLCENPKFRRSLNRLIVSQHNAKIETKFRKKLFVFYPVSKDVTKIPNITSTIAWSKLIALFSGDTKVQMQQVDIAELRSELACIAAVEDSMQPSDYRNVATELLLNTANIDHLAALKFLCEKCGLIVTERTAGLTMAYEDTPGLPIINYVFAQQPELQTTESKQYLSAVLFGRVILDNPSEEKIDWLLNKGFDPTGCVYDGSNILSMLVETIRRYKHIEEDSLDCLAYLLEKCPGITDNLLTNKNCKGYTFREEAIAMMRQDPATIEPFRELVDCINEAKRTPCTSLVHAVTQRCTIS